MPLTIPPGELHKIKGADDELLLGIILEGDVVRLQKGDRTTLKGHAEWLALEPMSDVKRGFSVGVAKGLVVSIYRSSTLNPGSLGELEDAYFWELLRLLPLADTFRVFE